MAELSEPMMRVTSLEQLAGLAEMVGQPYVRFSHGPAADHDAVSVDRESGCVLPGLSVYPLTPPPWWDRPVQHWIARQLRQYIHLGAGERYGWVLTGTVAGRGPDSEPLVTDVRPVAILDDLVLREAQEVYRSTFDPGLSG